MSDTSPAGPRRSRRIALASVAGAMFVLLLLGIPSAAAILLTRPERRLCDETPAMLGLPFEEARFPARGGDVEIAGWYIPRSGSERAVVLVHGKDSSRTREFHHHFIDLAAGLHSRGLSVLLIDLRGHGGSGDARFTFGIDEQRDIQGAVDWLRGRGLQAGRIGVLGVSMGGASSIYATANEPAIGALVVDSTFAEIYPVIEGAWSRVSGLPRFYLPLTDIAAQQLLGLELDASRPVDVIGRIAPRPVMVIHGTADTLIPVDHADRLRAAAAGAEYWRVEGGEHAQIYNLNADTYLARVGGFFARGLGGGTTQVVSGHTPAPAAGIEGDAGLGLRVAPGPVGAGLPGRSAAPAPEIPGGSHIADPGDGAASAGAGRDAAPPLGAPAANPVGQRDDSGPEAVAEPAAGSGPPPAQQVLRPRAE